MVGSLNVRRAHLLDLHRSIYTYPFEDGDRSFAVRHSTVYVVFCERDACAAYVFNELVIKLICLVFRFKKEIVERSFVIPVIKADGDGSTPIGEIKGRAGICSRNVGLFRYFVAMRRKTG